MNHKKSGSILLHVIVLWAIIIIITSSAITGISWFNRLILNAEVAHLQSICLYLQQKALCRHCIQTLTIDPHNNHYQYDATTHSLSPSIQFNFIPTTKGPPAHPTHLITSPCTFTGNTVSFYPTGTTSAGSLYLTNQAKSIQSALTLSVSPIPYIRLYHYHGNWKLIP